MLYEREQRVAVQAALLAGKLIMEEYARFEVIPDAPAHISTHVDRASQETILKHIRSVFPEDALRAEEKTPTLEQVPNTGPRLWIIDPIDGTRGFARKTGEFSVMVAFVTQGRPVVGVVWEPAKERLTFARLGKGCWRRDGAGPAETCCVTRTAALGQATVTQSHSKKSAPPSKQLEAIGPARVIETYSAGIKLAQVARGEADLYLNTYDAPHEWDICAGQILVEEAGGRVTNLEGKDPQYGQANTSQPGGLLASNTTLHEPALRAIRGPQGPS
jgi:3'(2'), 5'-bisphosphate nucleotidase